MTARPQSPPHPDCSPGSHWQQRLVLHSSVTIYHADCWDVLPTLGTVEACITDPPYYRPGASMKSGGDGWMPGQRKAVMQWNGDQKVNVCEIVNAAKIVAIWGGNYHSLPPSRGWLVWQKPDSLPTMADAELAWTNQDMNLKLISWSAAATNAERIGHPTQKPVRVMAWTMDKLGIPKGATVIDPYMGSGTTGIACIRTGRNFIGIERDHEHFATARRRIEDELRGDLFMQNDKLTDSRP